MPSINILTWHNGSGLQQDAQCLDDILTRAGFRVTQTNIRPPRLKSSFLSKLDKFEYWIDKSLQIWKNYSYRLRKKCGFLKPKDYRYDINLFLEFVDTSRFDQARKNCFIPNQEWFSMWQHLTLKSFDQILCKTLHAYDIFQRLGHSTSYISFTSQDHYRFNLEIDYNACFHLAGRSPFKGTQAIIDVWRRHPEWPQLYVIQRSHRSLDAPLPENITYIQQRIELERLTEMQNRLGIRIQTSEAEGFGHVLVEGMSCGAVMVTTDAPPMNEIVTPDRGILVAYDRSKPKDLGHQYFVNQIQLEQQLESLFKLDLEQRRELGDRARAWYLENDALFKQKIVEVMQDLLA